MNLVQAPLPSITEVKTPQASPLIYITTFHRYLIAGILGSFLIWLGFQHWQYPSAIAGMKWVFLALVVNFALYLMPIVFYQSSFGWFHPLIFNIFFGFFNHLRRFDVYMSGLQWHYALPGWSAEGLTQLLIQELSLQNIALIAFYTGFALSPNFKVPDVQFHQPRNLGFKVLLTVLFSAAVFAVYMQTRGGIINHILSWGQGRNEALAGAFYWQFFARFGLIASLSWLVIDRTSTARPMFWVCVVTSLSMSFLSGGSRSSVVYFMVMGLLAWQLRERKIELTRMLVITTLGLFILGILGNLRASTYDGTIDWNVLWGGAPQTSTAGESALMSGLSEVSERSSVFSGIFPILALVPNQVDFLHGDSYLAILTLPIPRALWADKPGLIAGMVGKTFFNANVGMPPGAIGEAYWNFGLPGVLLVFTLFGAFIKWIVNGFLKYANQAAAIVLYVITLFLLSEPSGLNIIGWLLMLVPAIVLLLGIGAMRIRSS